MAEDKQTFDTHARYVPGYHYVLGFLLVIFLVRTIVQFVRAPGGPALFGLVLSVSLVLMYWYARVFALTVQDRVIRLEERLRLDELLPPELRPRVGEFTRRQLVALRFASDAELPALARKVLEERIEDEKEIKRLITDWRPDHLRA